MRTVIRIHLVIVCLLISFLCKAQEEYVVINDWCNNAKPPITIHNGENIVWNAEKLLRGSVIVEAGGKLTIRCLVSFPKGASLTVEDGGELVIDEGELTSICGDTWEGIIFKSSPQEMATITNRAMPGNTKAAAAQSTFERTYGGTGNDSGYGIAGTADGGYLIAGSTSSFGIGAYAVRVDSVGDTLWTKIYKGSGGARAYSVDTTSNGFIIAGSTNSFGAGGIDILLIRIDSSGDTLWTRTFGGISHEKGTDVIANSEGGYTVAGNTSSFGAGSTDIVVINTDATGDTLWTRTYGLSQSESAQAIAQTSDSGYVMVGTTTSFSNGPDIFIIRINSIGDTLWTKVLIGPDFDEGMDIIQTLDGGFALCGYGEFSGTQSMVLVKLDQNGSVQWEKAYLNGTFSEGRALYQMPDGSFVIGGVTDSGADLFILKVNQFGAILWSNGFSYLGAPLTGMVPAKDGGFCMVGGGVYLVKVDSLGEGGCNSVTTSTSFAGGGFNVSSGCLVGSGLLMSYAPLNVLSTNTTVDDPCDSYTQEWISGTALRVFPNPFEETITISFVANGEERFARVYNLLGSHLLSEKIHPNQTSVELDLHNIPKGIYFVRISSETHLITKKIIKK